MGEWYEYGHCMLQSVVSMVTWRVRRRCSSWLTTAAGYIRHGEVYLGVP